MVLHLAKIDSGKDLREAYDFCPLLRGFPYLHFCPIDILLSIDRTAHLNQPDLKHTNLLVDKVRAQRGNCEYFVLDAFRGWANAVAGDSFVHRFLAFNQRQGSSTSSR